MEMTRTEYLTGHKPEHYSEELIPLVIKRVGDMREFLTVLRIEAKQLDFYSKEYKDIANRYSEIEKAITWWNELIES